MYLTNTPFSHWPMDPYQNPYTTGFSPMNPWQAQLQNQWQNPWNTMGFSPIQGTHSFGMGAFGPHPTGALGMHHSGAFGPYSMAPVGPYTPYNPYVASAHPGQTGVHNTQLQSLIFGESTILRQKMDVLFQQLTYLTELVSRSATLNQLGVGSFSMLNPYRQHGLGNQGLNPYNTSTPFGMAPPVSGGFGGYMTGNQVPVGVSYEQSPMRIRESENFLCWEIPFQGLGVNDIEIETLGNRVVCRTRMPLSPLNRATLWNVMSPNIQVFELPDGRVECSLALPFAFNTREVEAVFREGNIAVYIPKTEASERQSVRIGKEAPHYVTGGTGASKKGANAQM